jgi:hypothetical protein
MNPLYLLGLAIVLMGSLLYWLFYGDEWSDL